MITILNSKKINKLRVVFGSDLKTVSKGTVFICQCGVIDSVGARVKSLLKKEEAERSQLQKKGREENFQLHRKHLFDLSMFRI